MKSTTVIRNYKMQIAELYNVTPDYVAKVITGKRHNKAIADAYQIMLDAEEKGKRKLSKLKTIPANQ